MITDLSSIIIFGTITLIIWIVIMKLMLDHRKKIARGKK